MSAAVSEWQVPQIAAAPAPELQLSEDLAALGIASVDDGVSAATAGERDVSV